ncbi:MAG: type II toxin-antitoxin system RelE/ParE family toxin [Pseudomonadales bacterium]|jgi:putative addiction module killer protein|nr:type II toxin-antitoxin system RelE/ParE family toxin [Pseudomonadales bacterium]
MSYQIKQTEIFEAWHLGLRDLHTKMAIHKRIERAGAGNLGLVKLLGDDVSEMKIDLGPGYRLYFTLRGKTVVFLLCGGDKSTQKADIKLAKKLAKEL